MIYNEKKYRQVYVELLVAYKLIFPRTCKELKMIDLFYIQMLKHLMV